MAETAVNPKAPEPSLTEEEQFDKERSKLKKYLLEFVWKLTSGEFNGCTEISVCANLDMNMAYTAKTRISITLKK